MLSTPIPKAHSPSSSPSHSPQPSLEKNHSFMQRFKLNQLQLKSKFRKFLIKQKTFFPKAHQKMNITLMTQDSEVQPEDVREIRKERQRLQEQMKEAMNQSQYYLHRSKQYQRTCQQLQRRVKRVEIIRQDRKEQVSKLQVALRQISQSIHYEKRRFRDSIKASKANLTRSKLLSSKRKLTQALSVRHESQLHRSRIVDQREESEQHNRRRFLSVKEEERKAELSVSRIVQQKAGKAIEVKLQRLFRELAEKEEVKISSMKVREEADSVINKYKNKTLELQQRITHYRQSLGQRQPQPTPRITRIKFQNRRYHTEEHEFSTKSGFLSGNKQAHYADEPFDD